MLPANIYLHYSFGLWLNEARKYAQGDVVMVRYSDDSEPGCKGMSVGPETAAGKIWPESPSGENQTGTLWALLHESLQGRAGKVRDIYLH